MKKAFKKLIYICCFSFCCLQAYGQDSTKQQAAEMSNKLSMTVKGLFDYGAEWGKKFSHLDSTTRKYAELKPIRLKMQKYSADKLRELKAMKDVAGSEAFRMSVIHYLEAEKQLLDKGFIPIESLPANASPEQMRNAVGSLNKQSKREEEIYLKKIREAQADFAKKNGITIRN